MIASRPVERNCPPNDLLSPRQFTQLVNATYAVLGPDEARYIRETIAVVLELSQSRKRIDVAPEAADHAA